jgi:hypothetical protein
MSFRDSIVTVICVWLFSFYSYAQITFSKIYDTNKAAEYASKVIETDSGYLVYVPSGNYTTQQGRMMDTDKISITRSGIQNQDINLYFKGLDHAAYKLTYANINSRWTEDIIRKMQLVYYNGTPVTVYANWFDVQSDITPRANEFIYYRSVNNELKFSYRIIAWYDFTASELNKHIKPVNNCAGNIILEGNNRKVWYKGTDEKIRFWNPSTGQTGFINTNYPVHSFVMHSCGCLAFYRDNVFGLLWQLYKIGN